MFGIGWSEILIILVVALLVLGPSRLPEIARSLGRGLRDFRKALSSLDLEEDRPRPASWSADNSRPPAAPPAPPTPPALPPETASDDKAPEARDPDPIERSDTRKPG